MSRRDRPGPGLAAAAVLVAGLWLAALPSGTTYAAWSDLATVPGTAGAGVWLTEGDPPLPDQCLGMEFDRIIVGTNKDDDLEGTPGNDLVFGLQGKDLLGGMSGADCLVGGSGKDELRGGDGDDVLVGGNAKDKLTGGDDDVCDGGRGKNTLIQCAAPASATSTLLEAEAPTTSESGSVAPAGTSDAALLNEPTADTAPETGGGASVEDPPEAPLDRQPTGDVVDGTSPQLEDAAVEPVIEGDGRP